MPTTMNVLETEDRVRRADLGVRTTADANESAVAWAAIFAGAAAAAALSLILVVLGVGLGLSAVSPWAAAGIGSAALGVSTIVWLTITQLVASGMGGFLAGRLRTKWATAHSDETYFRDTAHGFLAWAIATLFTAGLLTSVIGSIVSGGAQLGGAVVGGVASTAMTATVGGAAAAGAQMGNREDVDTGGFGYFVDSLFRRSAAPAEAGAAPAAPRADVATPGEVSRIFLSSLRGGKMTEDDARYLAGVVTQRTGLSQDEAEKRVRDTFVRAQSTLKEAETTARAAAETARKASAYAALWLFVSLLCGAFAASFMATFGGRRRDAH